MAEAGTVHFLTLDEIRGAISELGFVPRQRNVFYELIDERATRPAHARRTAATNRLPALPIISVSWCNHLLRPRSLVLGHATEAASHRIVRAMIEVRSLSKAYSDLRRGQVMALDDVSFHADAGPDLRPAGAQRRRQDHGPAHPQHRARAHQRHGDRRRLRLRHAARAGPPPDRLHLGQHGRLRPHDRLGNGRILRPALRHGRRRACASGWSCCSTGSRCRKSATCSAPRCRPA